jgi:hypothetical protein
LFYLKALFYWFATGIRLFYWIFRKTFFLFFAF